MSFAVLSLLVLVPPDQTQKVPVDQVVARVDDEEIREGHVRLVRLLTNGGAASPAVRSRVIERLVENRLVVRRLKRNGIKVTRAAVTQAVRTTRTKLEARKVDLRQELRRFGLTEADLRSELEVAMLWRRHRESLLTPMALRRRFDERRTEYDGTRVRASQIFLKLSRDDPAAWKAAQAKLAALRREIKSGATTFAEAAKKHSQAPSGKSGGDIGSFAYSGTMPTDFTRHVFRIKPGEMTEPFQTQFGAHLCLVTQIRPGDLTPEDARPALSRDMSREIWAELVDAERKLLGDKVRLMK